MLGSASYSKKQLIIAASIGIVIIGLAAGSVWLYSKPMTSSEASRNIDDSTATATDTAMPPSAQTVPAQTADEPASAPTAPAAKPEATTNPPAAPKERGTYQAYSADNLKSAGSKQRVLFFHAPWCPQCRELEADIEQNGVPAGIAIFKIDYDSNQTLRQRYGVVQQTSVVSIDASGNKQALYLPYSDPRLANALRGLGL